MSKKLRKLKKVTSLELYKGIRKDWGAINPVQRVVPNKKKYTRKEKYKKDYLQ